jgi:transposase
MAITSFFSEFNQTEGCILFDGTDIVSYSENIGINKPGKSKKGTYDSLINLMFIFSVEKQLPIYYRILPGNIKDVKSFRLCLDESGIKDAIVIADKGFYSEQNIKLLLEQQLLFIIPLRRDSKLIDYEPAKQGNKKAYQCYFKFEERYIWYYQYRSETNQIVVYLDEELKTQEEKDFLNRISSCPEEYSLEAFHQKQHQFGTIALLNNIEKTPQQTYEDYKSRGHIETMIDTLKNIVEADHTYMQNEQSLEGWMFINYIALHWYYRIYQLLRKNNLNYKYSPMDLVKHLTEVRKVKINGQWHLAEITKKTSDLLKIIGIPIT